MNVPHRLVHGGRSRGIDNETTRLYGAWCGMLQRCNYPKHSGWKYYGAKGVKVCTDWQDFESFKAWAFSHGYAIGMTIDRLDSAIDYCPQNCEWVTRAENGRRAMQKRWAAHNLAKTQ